MSENTVDIVVASCQSSELVVYVSLLKGDIW